MQQQPRRRVVLVEEINIIPSPSPLERLEPMELDDLWYNAFEMNNFRLEAHKLGQRLVSSYSEKSICTLAVDEATRGLEQRCCYERQRRKYIANRYIVKAQQKFHGDAERLAALAQKCNQWATNLALEEGARDFLRAYADEFEATMSLFQPQKRSLEEDEPVIRCVRRKTLQELKWVAAIE